MSSFNLAIHVVPKIQSTYGLQVTVKSAYAQRLSEDRPGEVWCDMARHFAVPQLFRQMPNALMKRYCARHELFGDLDFEKMKQRSVEALVNAWEKLPGDHRRALEPQLREIFDLSSQKGTLAIIDEARWQVTREKSSDAGLVAKLSMMTSHFERAMTVFLDHPHLWKGATRFFRADSLSRWKKRSGFPKKDACLDRKIRPVFAADIGKWFRESQGRGRHCIVEVLRRGDRDYFFAYPEDFADQSLEYVDAQLKPRVNNPAFEVVFVWVQKEGALEVNTKGGPKVIAAMQELFARHILKLGALPPLPKNKKEYELGALKRAGFSFVFQSTDGIEDIWVRRLRYSSLSQEGDQVTFEADTDRNRMGVHDLIKRLNPVMPPDRWYISEARITARFEAHGDEPAKTRTFDLSHDSCSLKHDELGLKLHAVLAASKIESA